MFGNFPDDAGKTRGVQGRHRRSGVSTADRVDWNKRKSLRVGPTGPPPPPAAGGARMLVRRSCLSASSRRVYVSFGSRAVYKWGQLERHAHVCTCHLYLRTFYYIVFTCPLVRGHHGEIGAGSPQHPGRASCVSSQLAPRAALTSPRFRLRSLSGVHMGATVLPSLLEQARVREVTTRLPQRGPPAPRAAARRSCAGPWCAVSARWRGRSSARAWRARAP